MIPRWSAALALPLLLAAAGCSSLSDRDLLLHGGAFSVVPIKLGSVDHAPLDASEVVVDPGNHVVYVAGEGSDELAIVDGRTAHLVRYARVRPTGERGGPPEGLLASPSGNAILVRLPDFDGVPVMVHIGGEPSHVYGADAVDVSHANAHELPRRLLAASDEAGMVLLADMTPSGTDFQCLLTTDHAAVICPDPLDELPVALAYSPHFHRVVLLSAPEAHRSRLRVYGTAGELWSRELPGGPISGQVLVDEHAGDVLVIQQTMATLFRFPIDGGEPELLPLESGPIEMVQDPSTGLLYVACRDAHSVVVVDPAAGTTEVLELSDSPAAIAIDADAGYLFVALRAGREMAVVDLFSHAVATVDVGGPQRDVALDTGHGSGYAYVVVEGETLARMAY